MEPKKQGDKPRNKTQLRKLLGTVDLLRDNIPNPVDAAAGGNGRWAGELNLTFNYIKKQIIECLHYMYKLNRILTIYKTLNIL